MNIKDIKINFKDDLTKINVELGSWELYSLNKDHRLYQGLIEKDNNFKIASYIVINLSNINLKSNQLYTSDGNFLSYTDTPVSEFILLNHRINVDNE